MSASILIVSLCAAWAEPDASVPAAEAPEVEDMVEPEDDEPGKGDFDAGGALRMPSGPDENGEYGAFNWVAVDLGGRYFLSDGVKAEVAMPLLVVKPKFADREQQASLFGGFVGRMEAGGSTAGFGVDLGLMRRGGFLLSDKEYPNYVGALSFGTGVGPYFDLQTGLFNFYLSPVVVYQVDPDEPVQGLRMPLDTSVQLGQIVKVAVTTGIFTADDFRMGARRGATLPLGAAVDVKLGPLVVHLGTGAGSVLVKDDPGAKYPSLKESLYFDFNAKVAP